MPPQGGSVYKIGDKVKCITTDENVQSFGCCQGKLSQLSIGEIYKIRDIEVHSWHTKFYLEGIDSDFNEALFEAAAN
jgi:hypothetical protein